MKKILIVEDDQFIRDLYKDLLNKGGYEVIEAADGQEGLGKVNSKPDLVLLDLMLPKVSGIDFLKKVKSNAATKDIPVLILSNLGEEKIVNEVLGLGAKGYMIKAEYTPEEVVEQVKKQFP